MVYRPEIATETQFRSYHFPNLAEIKHFLEIILVITFMIREEVSPFTT